MIQGDETYRQTKEAADRLDESEPAWLRYSRVSLDQSQTPEVRDRAQLIARTISEVSLSMEINYPRQAIIISAI